MKLLLDEMISGQVAERLRRKRHDVIAFTAKPTLKGSSDPDVFEAAQAQKRTLVAYNRGDFEAIVNQYDAASSAHHGLVIVNPTRHPSDQFTRLVNALRQADSGWPALPGFHDLAQGLAPVARCSPLNWKPGQLTGYPLLLCTTSE